MLRPLRILTVARWYPSHDVRFRGAFVADLVAALGAMGHGTVVASWEPALVRGRPLSGADIGRAVAAWTSAVRLPAACAAPRAWGARVPVARLPVVDDAEHAGWRDRVAAHAALLEPFALELHRRWPVDVIHAHTGIPDGLAAAGLADRLGVPLVVTEHASDASRALAADPELAEAYRSLLHGRRRLAAISGASRRALADALGVAPSSIDVVGNVVDTAAFRPVGIEGRDADELLWVGERSAKKGTDVLLRAMALLAVDRPALRLRLVGRAPTQEVEAGLAEAAAALGLADRVAFEPPADRAGVAAAMARASTLVHPSPAETFGVVAAEALASGLPVAATPSGGVEEIVGRDGSLGVIASSHDPADLARAVAEVLDRRASFDPAAMHRSVDERFSARTVARAYTGLYGDLLGPGDEAAGQTASGVSTPEIPAAGPAEDSALVVALGRPLLGRRLAPVPQSVRTGLPILTTLAPRSGAAPLPADGAELIEVDPDAPFQAAVERLSRPRLAGVPTGIARAVRTLLHPLAPGARRRLRDRRDELWAAEAERLVLAAWRSRHAAGGGEGPWIVALDPGDVLASRAAIGAGARLAPGGLRWLVDRRDAASAPNGRSEAT